MNFAWDGPTPDGTSLRLAGLGEVELKSVKFACCTSSAFAQTNSRLACASMVYIRRSSWICIWFFRSTKRASPPVGNAGIHVICIINKVLPTTLKKSRESAKSVTKKIPYRNFSTLLLYFHKKVLRKLNSWFDWKIFFFIICWLNQYII